ncbi:hypothetical protein D3C71_1998090 [compost metagenome]
MPQTMPSLPTERGAISGGIISPDWANAVEAEEAITATENRASRDFIGKILRGYGQLARPWAIQCSRVLKPAIGRSGRN